MSLKDEIYSRGYTIQSFAEECGISRFTLNNILNRSNKVRGTTIYLIASTLDMSYEEVKALIDERKEK